MKDRTDSPYLVALALMEQEGRRALPLNGKSLSGAAAEAQDPGDDGRTLVLELLLRVWQRTDEGPLKRAAGDASLLLVEIPLEVMQERLPILKADWVNGGSTDAFRESLQDLVLRGWSVTFEKHDPVRFLAWEQGGGIR